MIRKAPSTANTQNGDSASMPRFATSSLASQVPAPVASTAPYYQEILRNPEFRSGQFNTSFVESHPELTQYSIKRNPSHLAIAIATAIAAHAGL